MTVKWLSTLQYILGAWAGACGFALMLKGHFWGLLVVGAIFAAISLWLDNIYEVRSGK